MHNEEINKARLFLYNLLSQLFANIYGHIFDRFVKTKLRMKNYFRYMDDTVIVCNSKSELVSIQRKLSLFSRLYMKLKLFFFKIVKYGVIFI